MEIVASEGFTEKSNRYAKMLTPLLVQKFDESNDVHLRAGARIIPSLHERLVTRFVS